MILSAALGLASGSASAVDGTITVLGEISTNTCSVTGGPGLTPVGGEIANFDVVLPTISTNSLPSGSTATPVPFHLTVSGPAADCPANTRVSAFFQGVGGNVDAAGDLMNEVSGTNVRVQLLDGQQSDNVINLNNSVNLGSLVTSGGTDPEAVLIYRAQYFAPIAATAGVYSSKVQYTVTYP